GGRKGRRTEARPGTFARSSPERSAPSDRTLPLLPPHLGRIGYMSVETLERPPAHAVEERESVTIRLAGDSGDGMQLAGTQFTHTSALLGNDISTLPDFPAEVRPPAGTLAGVSGCQIHFSSTDIHTPGDRLDTLVAMNPAALK